MTRSTIDPKPFQDTVEQVFLSPRVLDRTAFEEFAAELKALIERATHDSHTLQAAAAHAEAVYSKLIQVSPNIESKAADVEKAVRSILSVRDEAFTLLGRAEACVQRISGAEAHIDAVVEERLAAFGNRLQEALERAEQQISERVARALEKSHMDIAVVEARLNDSELRMRELSSAAAGLGTVCDRAAVLLGREADNAGAAPAAASLSQAILIAERTIAELHATGDQVASGCDAGSIVRKQLAQAILEAAALRDELNHRKESLYIPAAVAAAAPCDPPAPVPATEANARPEDFPGWLKLAQEIEAKPQRRKRAAKVKKSARKG
jgi:hypothetical protein